MPLARSIYATPCLRPISRKGFCSIAKRDDDDQMGTTVVAYIYKNKYYFVADSRISTVQYGEDKMMKTYSINSDAYTKFTKFGVDFYAIMAGAKSVMEKLFRKLATHFECQTDQISVKDIAVAASDYLIRYGDAKKAEIGLEPEDNKSEAYMKWKYETDRWKQRYGQSAAFICGYEHKVPKIYVSQYCYRVPLDISRDYTADQILNGVTEEEALKAPIKDHPPYFVLGSSRKVVIEFMSQKSRLFEGHRISFRGGPVDRDDIFDDISMELARAVVGAAVVDVHTGGEVHVRGICRGGRTLFFDCDVARVYLESYASFGGLPDLVFVPILACGGIGHESIQSLLGSLGSPKMDLFHRLGSIRGFGMHVVTFEDGVPDANIQIIHDKILKKAKGWGKLGLPQSDDWQYGYASLKFVFEREIETWKKWAG